MKLSLLSSLLCSVLFLQACVNTKKQSVDLQPIAQKTKLQVTLFSYLPDAAGDKFKSMMKRIEGEFERANAGVDLVLRPMDGSFDPYDIEAIKSRFASNDPNASDMIEIDTVMLGEVVKAGLIQTLPSAEVSNDWLPPASRSAHHNGRLYGIPHWLCGHFIIARDPAILKAGSAEELKSLLDAGNENIRHLSGNMLGSWNLPCLYIDAWADTHGVGNTSSAIGDKLDAPALASLKLVADEQTWEGKNPGLDGTYDDDNNPDLSAQEFAMGKAEALLGYSERLHVVLKNQQDAKPLHITSAPLGASNRPLAFTDVFVIRKGASKAVEIAALQFARYMTKAETYAWIHKAEDAPKTKRTPRYLAPATRSAYRSTLIKDDPLMQEIHSAMRNAGTFPQSGLLNARKAMRDAILAELVKP